MFTIDGMAWDIPCTIERQAEIRESEISGLLLDKTYFKDVIGTYMRYEVAIAVPFNRLDDYTTIYEMLTAPNDAHTFVLPYNQDSITISGMIDVVTDQFVKMPNNGQYWRGTKFSIVAKHPTKTRSLNEVIISGLSPLPEIASANIGDTYTYTESGWIPVYYDDADDIYY